MKLNLNYENWLKVFKGAAIAGAGVFLAYLAEHMMELDFGEYTALVAGVLMVLVNYGRKLIEEMKAPSAAPVLFLAVLLVAGLGGPAEAQTRPASIPVQETCLFGCRPKTDPALLALLQRIADQNQQIIALLMQMQGQKQQQQPLIVYGQPYQQLPIQGQPRQDLPIAGQPRQDLPIEGPPRQQVPIEGPPRQTLPEQGQPLQDLPGNAKPAPQPEGPPRLQELPTGYQQWNATRYAKQQAIYYRSPDVIEDRVDANGQVRERWINGKLVWRR